MSTARALVPVVAALVLVLTWFLLQGTDPDAPRSRPEEALRAIAFHNAALQRDVLRARAGLLRNYDPLVRSTERLLAARGELAASSAVARGDVQHAIDRRIDALAAAITEQETLVEAFKSDNALLRNSLAWFDTLSGRLVSAAGGRTALEREIGALTAAMLRFAHAPSPDTSRQVAASLDRLAALPLAEPRAADVRSLVAHGRLVLTMLPRVDDLVARLQSAATGAEARALQRAFGAARERAAARADLFLALLYVAALALVAWATWLFLRLRRNAQALRERLDLEALVASISTRFIDLPHERIGPTFEESLARLAAHAGLDRAQIVVLRDGEPESFFHAAPGLEADDAPPAAVAALVAGWRPAGYERQGCICIPDLRTLPDDPGKEAMQERGVQSWLCIPLQVGGETLGALALDAVRRAQNWRDDDIALLRTAAEIFASAIARERGEQARDELQARLNRSQRLEAIGTLAGGIAHEFNNILGAVRGYGEMALAALADGSRPRRHVEQILKAGARAQDVVEQVLAFGRRRERQHRLLEIESVIAEAVDLVRATFPATLSVRTEIAAGGAIVPGDRTELQQVVVNLCRNAAQAMDERGVLTLGLHRVDTPHATKLSHGSLSAGRWVRLQVTDTGHGIDPAVLERIFEPFFTTRPAGGGTGLGLPTVHGIVGGHGGAINVDSRPGRGATFEVYLPRAEQAAAGEHEPVATPLKAGHGETVLFVDDDEPLVLLGEEMLAALGYEPVGFGHAAAALAAVAAEPARFDLVLTDEIMPGMRGTELARAIHSLRPDLPVVLMTGYGRPLEPDRLRAAGVREVLEKPLLSRALADCLARQLPG